MVAQQFLELFVLVQIQLDLQFAALVKGLSHHTFYVRSGVQIPYAVQKIINNLPNGFV
jgi:hypothetical protein